MYHNIHLCTKIGPQFEIVWIGRLFIDDCQFWMKRLNLKNKSLWIKSLSPPALNAYSCTYVDTHNQDLRAWHLTVERVFF